MHVFMCITMLKYPCMLQCRKGRVHSFRVGAGPAHARCMCAHVHGGAPRRSMRGCFNIGKHMRIQILACMHAYICLDMSLLTADALHAVAKPSRLEPSIIRLAGNLADVILRHVVPRHRPVGIRRCSQRRRHRSDRRPFQCGARRPLPWARMAWQRRQSTGKRACAHGRAPHVRPPHGRDTAWRTTAAPKNHGAQRARKVVRRCHTAQHGPAW